ncbi:MAG TPA: hypothetical protein VN541_12060 [Tepidisphaeraceae bacterium]|nr:hypothetical protein [Tepidisphaeraceae bacterium]
MVNSDGFNSSAPLIPITSPAVTAGPGHTPGGKPGLGPPDSTAQLLASGRPGDTAQSQLPHSNSDWNTIAFEKRRILRLSLGG